MAQRKAKDQGETYVVARGLTDRPLCMHRIDRRTGLTACGADVSGWSVRYLKEPIDVILCRRTPCYGEKYVRE